MSGVTALSGMMPRLPQTWAETARSGRRQAAGVLVVLVGTPQLCW